MWTPRQRHTLRALPVRVIAPVVDLGDAVDLEADPIIGPHREEVGPAEKVKVPFQRIEKVSGAVPLGPPPPQSKASAVVEEGTGLVSVGPAGAVVCGAPAMGGVVVHTPDELIGPELGGVAGLAAEGCRN